MEPKTAATDAFWQDFAPHAGLVAADYQVVAFGDGPEMATELAALVMAGTKRTTASLMRTYADGCRYPRSVISSSWYTVLHLAHHGNRDQAA